MIHAACLCVSIRTKEYERECAAFSTAMLRTTIILTLALSTLVLPANGAETKVTVRAVSRDAKILGDGVGGARVTIRDVDTGALLATGIQTGGTGDTRRIMHEPHERGSVVYDTEGAAAFRATLDITRPTRIEVVAEGPLKYPHALQRASQTLLLIPGQHVEGDGVLLEIPGFIVDAPPTMMTDSGQPFVLRAKVTMTCGCPTEPGGLWNADQIRVGANILRDGVVLEEIAFSYAGETSTYVGTASPLGPGSYTVEIIASDNATDNAGRTTTELTVQPAREQ